MSLSGHYAKRASAKKTAEVADDLDIFRPGSWRSERWRRMWHDDVESRRRKEGRKVSKQSRRDREWIDARREKLLGKLREWDKDHERAARDLKGQLAKLDLALTSGDGSDGEEAVPALPGKLVARGKDWKNALRGGGDSKGAQNRREPGYSIGE